MQIRSKTWIALCLAALAGALALFAAGCGEDDNPTTVTVYDTTYVVDPDRVYIQMERLGNPLTSEVFLAKREHPHHNSVGPASDVASFKDQVEGTITGLGRTTMIATTVSSVLLPDELIVDTSKSSASAGWLSWALAAGYGGRKLDGDAVDLGLVAVFGNVLDPAATVATCLTTDNVGANDRAFSSTFPYLGTAH